MDLEITFQQGGTREFQTTGIYPVYLFFNLKGTKQITETTTASPTQKSKKNLFTQLLEA